MKLCFDSIDEVKDFVTQLKGTRGGQGKNDGEEIAGAPEILLREQDADELLDDLQRVGIEIDGVAVLPLGLLQVAAPKGRVTEPTTGLGEAPVYDSPPPGRIRELRIYASRRDRFDDPDSPRIPGRWELILRIPANNGSAGDWIPTDTPTVLAGFDGNGKIVEWGTEPRDRDGRSARFYAFAGDHYSLAQPRGRHFCVGCHAGHSGLPPEAHQHAERQK